MIKPPIRTFSLVSTFIRVEMFKSRVRNAGENSEVFPLGSVAVAVNALARRRNWKGNVVGGVSTRIGGNVGEAKECLAFAEATRVTFCAAEKFESKGRCSPCC